MNKFRLYCLLNKNTKLSYKRSPMFEQNKWAKALIYFGSALFGLYLILYGIIIAMTADGEACLPDYARHDGEALYPAAHLALHRHRLFLGFITSQQL